TTIPLLSTAPHLQMEERVPLNTISPGPDHDDDNLRDLGNPDPEAQILPGTFVVQVPKDQIYRIPPPENALILERRQNPEKKKRDPYRSCCLYCCIVISIIVLGLGLTACISLIFLTPKDPNFNLERILANNQTSYKHPEYDITLKAENPNKLSGVLYKQNGVASLSFRQQGIATGSYPTFYQERKSSNDVSIVLKGSNIMLPNEIDESIKTQNRNLHVSMLLKITVPVKMKTGFFNAGKIKIVVTCDFMVDNLAKGSNVLSQQCQTERQE
ncbi:LEA_2 domain-containing protein, partial [Cephalotus follicularis]